MKNFKILFSIYVAGTLAGCMNGTDQQLSDMQNDTHEMKEELKTDTPYMKAAADQTTTVAQTLSQAQAGLQTASAEASAALPKAMGTLDSMNTKMDQLAKMNTKMDQLAKMSQQLDQVKGEFDALNKTINAMGAMAQVALTKMATPTQSAQVPTMDQVLAETGHPPLPPEEETPGQNGAKNE
jgi:uncharacterized phage infection (PIP) family protein YhgE